MLLAVPAGLVGAAAVLIGAAVVLVGVVAVPSAHADSAWVWPLSPQPPVVRGFDPPDEPWGSGHRGVDLLGAVDQSVHAAGAGTVTYAGKLAGRGVVTVAHGALRTTYEPVRPTVRVGARVAAGDVIGTLDTALGHCRLRVCLHWGVRRGETYLDPLTLVAAGPPRLLPLHGPSDSALGTRLMEPPSSRLASSPRASGPPPEGPPGSLEPSPGAPPLRRAPAPAPNLVDPEPNSLRGDRPGSDLLGPVARGAVRRMHGLPASAGGGAGGSGRGGAAPVPHSARGVSRKPSPVTTVAR